MNLQTRIISKLIDWNEKLIFERRLSYFFKKEKIQLNHVLDIGANRGQMIKFFLNRNPGCNIYAFEPNPFLFKFLRKKYTDIPNVRILPFGVSNANGYRKFYENVLDSTSSFEVPNLSSVYFKTKAKLLGVPPDGMVRNSYDVETKTLFTFLTENVLEGIDWIKIDTEGHELACLEGLFEQGCPIPIRRIQLERRQDDMYENQFELLDKLLNENGFSIEKEIDHGFGKLQDLIYKNLKLS